MNGTVLISVIIPIYQVEAYLEKCIDSILLQSYRRLEIILVDDGSRDRCGEICDRYALQDNRIRVIHQSNQGLSAARNAGMEIATGDYISFIDSDDYIDSRFYELLLKGFQDHPEVLITACQSYQDKDGNISPLNRNWHVKQPVLHSHLTFCEDSLLGKQCVTVWNKLYRAELLKDVRFRVGRIVEDNLFMYDLSLEMPRHPGYLLILPDYLYYYRIRQGSICHSEEPLAIESIHAYKDICEESREKNPDFSRKMKARYHHLIISFNGQLELNKEWKRKYASTFRPLLKTVAISEIINYRISVRSKLAALVIRICPSAYPILRKIKRTLMAPFVC